MNLLILSKNFGHYDNTPLKILRKEKININFYDPSKKNYNENIFKKIKNIDLLICGTINISKKFLMNAKKLKCISKIGIGLDNINLFEAKKNNIKVYNTPDEPTKAAVDFTLAQIMSSSRMIFFFNDRLKRGKWEKLHFKSLDQLKIGIIGVGRIGGGVIRKLNKLNIKNIFANDINYNKKKISNLIFKKKNKEYIYKNCDIITFHIPLTPITNKIVDKGSFSLMKKDAILINNSRGGIFNEKDLVFYLRKKKFRSVLLDVFSKEPYNGVLKTFSNCILTPHVAASTIECRVAMEKKASLNIIKFLKQKNSMVGTL